MDMLTEKVVLVTSPLLCAMPPLRLPGMPLPWCFFWLPTIVSMEWLRTRMALCGRGDRGQQVSTTQRGAVPRTPPQLQVFPRHMGEQPAYASPKSKHTPTTARLVTSALAGAAGHGLPLGSPTATTGSDFPPTAL